MDSYFLLPFYVNFMSVTGTGKKKKRDAEISCISFLSPFNGELLFV